LKRVERRQGIPLDEFKRRARKRTHYVSYREIREWVLMYMEKLKIAPSEQALVDKFGIKIPTLRRKAKVFGDRIVTRKINNIKYFIIEKKS